MSLARRGLTIIAWTLLVLLVLDGVLSLGQWP